MRFRLPRIAKQHPIAFIITLVFHIIILILILSYTVKNTWQGEKIKPKQKIISPVSKVNLLDAKLVEQEKKRLIERREKKKQEIEASRSKLLQLEKKRKQEEGRVVQAKKKRKVEELARIQAEKKRKQEEGMVVQAKKKRKVEELARIQAEKKRKQAEIEHKNIIVKNLALDKKIALVTEQFKKSEIRRKLTQELTKEEIEENEKFRKKQLIDLTSNYIAQIEAKTRSNWRRNANTKDGWSCSVYVRQTKEGKIKLVKIDSCNNQSKDFRRSVESAVYKAEPLPKAPIDEVFDGEIQFNFIVR